MTEITVQAGRSRDSEARAGGLLPFRRLKGWSLAAGLALLSGSVWAEAPVSLDIPYVPTPQHVVDRMLQMAGVKSTDYVMDVACGDGRMIVTAAKEYGARGFCNDIDPARIKEARENAKQAGVTDKIEFRQGDLYKVDISKADVLPMYLLESVNQKLKPKILANTKPGTRVVSHAFTMGDWKPDMQEVIDGRTVYLWVVPAKVDGRWKVKQGQGRESLDLTIRQNYQEFSGNATIHGRTVPVRDGRIRGTEITFSMEEKPGEIRSFRGRVNGKAIEALANSGQSWLAKRR